MQYTLDRLLDITKEPIDIGRWGKDTSKVLSIIHSIKNANCSSCMLRRKVLELNSILEAYGDYVGTSTNYYAQKVDPNINIKEYIPCPDCVAKHLATCFVLQGEFYQGYTERLPLIESNLNEALLECPPDNKALKRLIKESIHAVAVDKTPMIPIILADQLNPKSNTKTEVSTNVPGSLAKPELDRAISRMSQPDLKLLEVACKNIPNYVSYDDTLTRFEWAGRLNLMADVISPYSPMTARVIRARRIRCYDNPTDPSIDPIWISCSDIVEAIRRHK